jgi:hypothetical protein
VRKGELLALIYHEKIVVAGVGFEPTTFRL